MEAITNVKTKISELESALPKRAVIDWGKTDNAAVEAFLT